MLRASQTPSGRQGLRGYQLVVFLTAMLMTYTLLIGWGLIGGFIPYRSAYLLIALTCLAPVGAYIYGFMKVRESEQDWGLLLSAIGWAFVMIALLIQHSALQTQLNNIQGLPFGVIPGGLESSALICLIIAITLMVGGAALSLQAWNRERTSLGNAERDERLRENARRNRLEIR